MTAGGLGLLHLRHAAQLARGEDGFAFRERNLMRAEEMPCTNGFGAVLHGMRHDAVMAKMQALMDLPTLHAEIAALLAEFNQARGQSLVIHAEYLEAIIVTKS